MNNERKTKIVLMDPDNEYKDIPKMMGYNLIISNSQKDVKVDPFQAATESGNTITEKETRLRELLDLYKEYGKIYSRQRLRDMSFLDNEPIWKERAISIFKEYANM